MIKGTNNHLFNSITQNKVNEIITPLLSIQLFLRNVLNQFVREKLYGGIV
jgi:hypothetical protein